MVDRDKRERYRSLVEHQISKRKSSHESKMKIKSTQLKTNLREIIGNDQLVVSHNLVRTNESLIQVNINKTDRRSYPTDDKDTTDEIVTINVSGIRYQTHSSTLKRFPETLLGDENKRKDFWKKKTNELFFDRNRACFEAILHYYQSNGQLRRPDSVPLDTFIEEIVFFQLGTEAMNEIQRIENISIVKNIDLPNLFWRRYIWFYMECPQESRLARAIYLISMTLTIISCLSLAVETLPNFDELYSNASKICRENENQSATSTVSPALCPNYFASPFFIIQSICVSYFTIEFLLRFISTPSYVRFFFSILNWIDLAAIIPYFVLLALSLTNDQFNFSSHSLIALRLLRSLRFLRIFKIHLVFKQFKSLRVLSSTLRESFVDFVALILILTLLAFLFGAAIYFAEENENPSVFDSIPKSTYWGIITIVAVGYGDMYPSTVIGKILACFCALLGSATVGMLVSVLVDRYQRIHSRKKFLPEQIISPVDLSDSEHDQKEDFIRKKLSGANHTSLDLPNIFGKQFLARSLPINDNQLTVRRVQQQSHLRFIVSLIDDKSNKRSSNKHLNELIDEINDLIKRSQQNLQVKFVSIDHLSSSS